MLNYAGVGQRRTRQEKIATPFDATQKYEGLRVTRLQTQRDGVDETREYESVFSLQMLGFMRRRSAVGSSLMLANYRLRIRSLWVNIEYEGVIRMTLLMWLYATFILL